MKKTSILIPVYNNSYYTKNCILSIYRTTKMPIELIVINNASTDNTLDILKDLKNEKPDNVLDFVTISNKENIGCLSAFNQGIKLFSGDRLLLQNNDCLMTTNWLEELTELIESDKSLGIIAPLANLFEGKTHPHPQLIFPAYESLDQLEEFAQSLRNKNTSRMTEAEYVFGHCMMIKKEVFEKIGNFDERYGFGYFEEIDFCRRAKNAGFSIKVANKSFVHHFGNKTFDLLGINRNELLSKNKKIFSDKWGEEFNDSL